MRKAICWIIALTFLLVPGCSNEQEKAVQQKDMWDAIAEDLPLPMDKPLAEPTSRASTESKIKENDTEDADAGSEFVYLLTKVTADGHLLTGDDKGEHGGIGPGVGVFQYDAQGRLISKEWTGAEDVMWYTANDPSFRHLTEWTYDPEGRVSTRSDTVSGTVNGEEATSAEERTWSFDAYGSVTRQEYSYHTSWDAQTGNTVVEQYSYRYDASGRIVEKAEHQANETIIHTYTYSESGKKLSDVQRKRKADGSEKTEQTILWSYDSSDRLVSKRVYDSKETLKEETTYAYDAAGNVIAEDQTSKSSASRFEYEYDDRGDLILRTYYYAHGDQPLQAESKNIYERDPDGTLIREEYRKNNTVVYRILYAYFLNGRLQQKQEIHDSSQWLQDHVRYTWRYDENGNLAQYIVERYDHPDERYHLFTLTYEYEKRKVS